jgi:hypothetical protein
VIYLEYRKKDSVIIEVIGVSKHEY